MPYQAILRACVAILRRRLRISCCWPGAIGIHVTGPRPSVAWVGGSHCSAPPCSPVCKKAATIPIRKSARLRGRLSRLGERQALHWFQQTLTSEDPQRVHEALQLVANEGLTLLWPDLDRLADSEDPDIARHCQETLERLCEDLGERR